MTEPVRVPDLGTAAARLSVWHVAPGEAVLAGDRVAEVVIPGAAVDVHAPAGGVVTVRRAAVGDPVAPGDVLADLLPDGD